MIVMKFGGSSVRDATCMDVVVGLVREELGADGGSVAAVVVSALGGVTDSLIEAARAGSARGEHDRQRLEALRDRHREMASQVAAPEDLTRLLEEHDRAFGELDDLLLGVSLVRACPAQTLDRILSQGERLSAELLAANLRRHGTPAEACDARQFIVTDRRFGAAEVEAATTYERIAEYFAGERRLQVVTGFIGATPEGETTTLGRGGTDLTAALLGAALGADAIQIWTDVDGVMSADPRLVEGAFSHRHLSYEELMELSHFGAKVVYAPTVLPARRSAIPLLIKNTFNPDFPGTRIEERPVTEGAELPVTGVTSISRAALMRLEGDGMIGVPGTAARLFAALARKEISVILISQASSEHSICFAIDPSLVERARLSVNTEFAAERASGALDDVLLEGDQSIVAVVGAGMRERPGIAGRLFRLLGLRGINVRAIAQGSSELNISLVLAQEDERRAVVAIHDAFFSRDDASLSVIVAGVGQVGGELLRQLEAHRTDPASNSGLDLRLAGILNSRQMLLDRRGIGDRGERSWHQALEQGGEARHQDDLTAFIRDTPGTRVFVDCTASAEMAHLYPALLSSGAAVVSANKRPFAGPMAELRPIWSARLPFARGLYYEATVGAGLPVLRTLRSLLDSGDRLRRVEGVFSGTLSFLLSELHRGQPFSAALRQAEELGFTEPDPRDDLSGMDVARKLLILAREAGLEVEIEDIAVEPFIPEAQLTHETLAAFRRQLDGVDRTLEARVRRAAESGARLCYLARLDDDGAAVRLTDVAPSHPCATVDGTDNVFAFYTDRYRQTPLVIRGPGAGPEVTAGGVFADLLRAYAECGERGPASGHPLP